MIRTNNKYISIYKLNLSIKNIYPICVLLTSLCIQIIAGVFLFPNIITPINSLDKILQAFIILSFSFAITPFFLIPNKILSICILIIKFCFLLFFCQTTGADYYLFLLYPLSLIVEIVFIFPLFWGLIPVPFIIIIEIFVLRPHYRVNTLILGITNSEKLLLVVFCIFFALTTTLVHWYWQEYKKKNTEIDKLNLIVKNITNTNLEYQNYAQALEQKTIINERIRISREIHDIIGYTMTNVLMLIQAAQNTKDVEKSRKFLAKAQTHLSSSVEEARLALRRMRDKNIQNQPRLSLFFQLTKTFSEISGIKIVIDFGNMTNNFSNKTEKAIFRMLQESMVNSFRHGKATLIDISFRQENGIIELRIRDNGSFVINVHEKIKEGIGIKGMRERIEALGGSLIAKYLVDGFLLQAFIPMEVENE